MWPLYLYLIGLQDQPPASSRRSDIIFDLKSEILILKNLYLDMYDGLSVWPLYLYLAGLQDQPQATSRRSAINFDTKIEILILKTLYVDMYDGL